MKGSSFLSLSPSLSDFLVFTYSTYSHTSQTNSLCIDGHNERQTQCRKIRSSTVAATLAEWTKTRGSTLLTLNQHIIHKSYTINMWSMGSCENVLLYCSLFRYTVCALSLAYVASSSLRFIIFYYLKHIALNVTWWLVMLNSLLW